MEMINETTMEMIPEMIPELTTELTSDQDGHPLTMMIFSTDSILYIHN